MGSFSIWHFVIVLVIIIMSVFSVSALSASTSALVVKKFHASETPRDDGAYVEIIARQSGLAAWLFALLKIDPTYEMKIFFTRIEYLTTSFSGFNRLIVPFDSVSSTFVGVSRPWLKAIMVFFIFLALAVGAGQADSIFGAVILMLLGIGFAVLVFILNRQLLIGFNESIGDAHFMRLQRSVIEGVTIDEKKLEEITLIIIAILEEHKKPRL